MLNIYRSNRAEWLVNLLGEHLKIAPPPVYEPLNIIVNSFTTSRWISERIAFTNGINSQIKFPFPRSYFLKIANKILEIEEDSKDEWKSKELVWPILENLSSFLLDNDVKILSNWLKDKGESDDVININKWQLAKTISDTLDDYILYRPEMIESWVNDKNTNINTEKNKHIIWQKKIFKIIYSYTKEDPISLKIKKAINYLKKNKTINFVLPQNIYFFGVNNLPPIYHDFIKALSGKIDVQIYLLTSSKDLWHRLESRRLSIGREWIQPVNQSWLLSAPRLEAALGKIGSEFEQLLEGTGENQFGDVVEKDFFASPVKIAKNENRHPSLLEQLQEKLVLDKSKSKLSKLKDDNSILFIGCSNERRQVQVIRDQIIQLLALEISLEPKDIIIMTPQIEKYAPLISSVFNDKKATNVDIPWTITDSNNYNEEGFATYIQLILELSAKRLTSITLNDFLSTTVIEKIFKFSADELNKITIVLKETGFKWGLDAEERDGNDIHSLNWCLERWILGIAIPSKPGLAPGGIAPYSTNLSTEILFKWYEILTLIKKQIKDIRKSKTMYEWSIFFQELQNKHFKNNWVLTSQNKSFNIEMKKLVKESEKCNMKIDCNVISQILNLNINNKKNNFSYRCGKITVSPLEPLTAIPHQVIILIGLDDAHFPGKVNKYGFNLLSNTYKLGDPSPIDLDRYSILESIISSRKKLIFTWNNVNEKSGENLPPSSPIQQVIEYLSNEIGSEKISEIFINAPANPLDNKNFIKLPTKLLISCDRRNLETNIWISKNKISKQTALALPLNWENYFKHDSKEISYSCLLDWIVAPQLAWLKHYNVNPKEWFNRLADIDELSLEEWTRSELIKNRINSSENIKKSFDEDDKTIHNNIYWREVTNGMGVLPPKSAKQIEIDLLEKRWSSLKEIFSKYKKIKNLLMEFDDITRELIWADNYCFFIDYGKLKYKTIMGAWLNHVHMCSIKMEITGTIIVSRKTTDKYNIDIEFKPIETNEANKILSEMKNLALQGIENCWPAPPISSWVYANAKRKNPDKVEKIFENSWEGNSFVNGENSKPELKICFGNECRASVFLESKAFKYCVSKLYSPMFNYIK